MFNKLFVSKKETVVCKTCKCLLYKEDAKTVKTVYGEWTNGTFDIEYYCETHKPPYDMTFFNFCGVQLFKKLVEVTEKGTPVGYTEIKRKGTTA
jgi:hypothetical protein